MESKIQYNYVDNFLKEIQSKGRYSVTLTEIRNKFDVSAKAILQKIYRLKTKNQLAHVRKEFYVIVPPQYSQKGMLPPTLFIDDLMAYLNRVYYIGLLSAAALHGSANQQHMELQVIINKPPLRNIINDKLAIKFLTKTMWKKSHILEKKTESGYINVSSPELTLFDLVDYNRKTGGLNRVLPVIEELCDQIQVATLTNEIMNQTSPLIQRTGFLLDFLGKTTLTDSLYSQILSRTTKPVLLYPHKKSETGIYNEKWKVIVNTEIEPE